jgi:hypothetical protein
MATIKSFTDIPQSQILAKILPHESADMHYRDWKRMTKSIRIAHVGSAGENDLPCWSLASLLEQIPYEVCDDDGNSSYLQINKDDDMYQLEYTDPSEIFESIETNRYEHFVDACVEMIEKLHKLNLL